MKNIWGIEFRNEHALYLLKEADRLHQQARQLEDAAVELERLQNRNDYLSRTEELGPYPFDRKVPEEAS